MVLLCGMAFILFDLERDTGALALDPRDGHLARHRPVAGVLLDELLCGHELLSKNGFEDHALMRASKGSHPICA